MAKLDHMFTQDVKQYLESQNFTVMDHLTYFGTEFRLLGVAQKLKKKNFWDFYLKKRVLLNKIKVFWYKLSRVMRQLYKNSNNINWRQFFKTREYYLKHEKDIVDLKKKLNCGWVGCPSKWKQVFCHVLSVLKTKKASGQTYKRKKLTRVLSHKNFVQSCKVDLYMNAKWTCNFKRIVLCQM